MEFLGESLPIERKRKREVLEYLDSIEKGLTDIFEKSIFEIELLRNELETNIKKIKKSDFDMKHPKIIHPPPLMKNVIVPYRKINRIKKN